MLDEDPMRALRGLAAGDEILEHLFRHGQISTIIDASDRPSTLAATHDAEELCLRTLAGLKGRRGELDGIFAEDDGGWHAGESGQDAAHASLCHLFDLGACDSGLAEDHRVLVVSGFGTGELGEVFDRLGERHIGEI